MTFLKIPNVTICDPAKGVGGVIRAIWIQRGKAPRQVINGGAVLLGQGGTRQGPYGKMCPWRSGMMKGSRRHQAAIRAVLHGPVANRLVEDSHLLQDGAVVESSARVGRGGRETQSKERS